MPMLFFILQTCMIFVLIGIDSIGAKIIFQEKTSQPYLVVLGIAQDGGVPQAGTKKQQA